MTNIVTKWKKYLLKELTDVELATQRLELDKKALASAKAEEAARKKAQQEEEKAKRDIGRKPTEGTTSTLEETDESFGGIPDGSTNVPYSSQKDIVNVKISDNLAIMDEELTEQELEEACGEHEGIEEGGKPCKMELQYEEADEHSPCNECTTCKLGSLLTEAKYKGRKVTLNKPMRGDVKKFKVFVRDPSTGNVKKVNFGDKKMRIKKSNPKRRKSFRARHHCSNPGPKTKARYWSCKKW